MLECARCGAVADFDADGRPWCGPTCLELERRGIAYVAEEAPLRLEGAERAEAVEAMLEKRAEAELDRLERQARLQAREVLRAHELGRYAMPEADEYGRTDTEGWLHGAPDSQYGPWSG